MTLETGLLLYVAVLFTSVVLMYFFAKTAPCGFEDDEGFHSYQDMYEKEVVKNKRLQEQVKSLTKTSQVNKPKLNKRVIKI